MKTVVVSDKYQKNYEYVLSQPLGKNFSPDFKPELTPKTMLELGIFGGKYISDKPSEFPTSWFTKAKFAKSAPEVELNYFGVLASQPLGIWQIKGWIKPEDPRGWFQWYCRYYMGRRIAGYDDLQIKRWKAMRRHIAQIKAHCRPGDQLCRQRQRQALLHWAYDSRKI